MSQTNSAYTWLCRNAEERGRLLDMSRRLERPEQLTILAVVAFAASIVPYGGPALLCASLAGSVVFAVLRGRMTRSAKPEHPVVLALVIAEALLAVGIAETTSPQRLLLLPLLGVPTLIAACVWPTRGTAAATALTVVAIVGVAFATDAHAVLAKPPLVIYPIAVLAATVVVASAARGADVASRAAAAVDQLTGLLNRSALLDRAAELAHQAQLAGAQAALVLADLDHFKEVNDTFGHAKGDEVLSATAALLRQALGGEGTLYRFGGEELVGLLPSADLDRALAVAERMRRALEENPPAGISVTASFGVAAIPAGAEFEFERLLAIADEALYEAKQAGRNLVRGQGGVEPTARRLSGERRRNHAERPTAPTSTTAPTTPQAGKVTLAAARERSFLAADDAQRAHMLDLIVRIKQVRLFAYGATLVAILTAGPYFGFFPALPPLLSAVVMGVTIEVAMRRSRRPELPIAAAVLFSQVVNTQSFLLTVNRPFLALSALVVLVAAWAPMFPPKAVAVGTTLQAALICEAAFYIGGSSAIATPYPLGVPLTLLVACGALTSALGRSSVSHRDAAVVDPLTGMLNRAALEAKLAALAHELPFAPIPLALIMVDIDHFKHVNDGHGHKRGDAVLQEVAYRIRRALRAFDSAYRYGGEEFLVVLPGVEEQEAIEIAQRVRTTIEREQVAGLQLTVSCGVATYLPSTPFDYEQLFACADERLYEAKRAGRNQVRPEGSQPQQQLAFAAG